MIAEQYVHETFFSFNAQSLRTIFTKVVLELITHFHDCHKNNQ